jgi:hypothetical protein
MHLGPHVGDALPPASGFQGSVSYRWLQSDRHFVGDDEQEHRQEEGSEVVNNSNFIDLGLTYSFSPRFSATLTVPYSMHERSQVVRSNDTARTILDRFQTSAGGLGDVRLQGNGWILNPAEPRRANLLLGVGLDYVVWPRYGLLFNLGARVDGVPVEDLVGGSDGFRRPGYSVSIEPGLSAMLESWSLSLYTPVALYRNRQRSVADEQWTEATGIDRHGDAAFADFSIPFSLAKRF